jgi:amino acid transporter
VITEVAKLEFFFPKYTRELELENLNPRFRTPISALVVQFVWCTLIIIFVGSTFTTASFTMLSTFAMFSYWMFYPITGIGLLVCIQLYLCVFLFFKDLFI